MGKSQHRCHKCIARPAGMLSETMSPGNINDYAYFWSTTEYDGTTAMTKWLTKNSDDVAEGPWAKDTYRSVRCKMD